MWFVQGVEMERLNGQLAKEQQSKQRLQEQVTKLKEQLGTGGPGDQGERAGGQLLGGDVAGEDTQVSGAGASQKLHSSVFGMLENSSCKHVFNPKAKWFGANVLDVYHIYGI
jgi:hypothetical protein